MKAARVSILNIILQQQEKGLILRKQPTVYTGVWIKYTLVDWDVKWWDLPNKNYFRKKTYALTLKYRINKWVNRGATSKHKNYDK